MTLLVDLSQEIFAGMPVFAGLPNVAITVHATHEEWDATQPANTRTPGALTLTLGDHTGTHVDALSHMGREYSARSIDTMPLSMFYTDAVCLDLSNKGRRDIIHAADLADATQRAGVELKAGSTVLLYTDHYRRTYGGAEWEHGPGLSAAAAHWLGEHRIAAFGVETMSPGIPGVTNQEVHRVCGELGFTHYENLINLHLLVGRGSFRFIALPLKIRGGTGSPVRAVAVVEDSAASISQIPSPS